jgi:AcrR family transcriptional regulator
MSDVAARAGVGKATIYRRYESKDDLVTEVLATVVGDIEIPDCGSTHGDLLELMLQTVELYSGSLAAGLMASLLEETRRNRALARSLREGFLVSRREALSTVLERGMARGDLRADLDLDLALDVLAGPVFYRLLFTGGDIDESLAHKTVDLMMRGFAPEAGQETSMSQDRRRK